MSRKSGFDFAGLDLWQFDKPGDDVLGAGHLGAQWFGQFRGEHTPSL